MPLIDVTLLRRDASFAAAYAAIMLIISPPHTPARRRQLIARYCRFSIFHFLYFAAFAFYLPPLIFFCRACVSPYVDVDVFMTSLRPCRLLISSVHAPRYSGSSAVYAHFDTMRRHTTIE